MLELFRKPEAFCKYNPSINANTNPPSLFMAAHTRTDSEGNYRMSLPPGDYEIRANMDGYLFDGNDLALVAVTTGETTNRDFDLPATGYLEVSIGDQDGPVPAKLQLVGFDPSPPLKNAVLIEETGVFGDVAADRLPYGIAVAAPQAEKKSF